MRTMLSSKWFSKTILVLYMSFVIMVSFRFTWFNAVNYDEGIYLLISRLFSEGTVLYTEIIPVTKPPLIFLINAVLIRLFDSDFFLARLFILAISVLSAFLIYRITYCLVKNLKTALLASILFSVFSSLPLSEIFWVMTEPYVILFELGALYFLIKFKLTSDSRNLVFSGILVSGALLTRQTAGIFLLLCFLLTGYWKFKRYFSIKRILPHMLFGMALPIILVILFFGYLGAVEPMIYQTTIWAGSDVLRVTGSTWLRQQWFFEYLVFSSPLWFMAALSLIRYKDLKGRSSDYTFVFFLFSWTVTVVAFYKLLFGPGFHHEYSETLAPLSILSSLGIYSAYDLFSNITKVINGHEIKGIRTSEVLKVLLISMLLVLLCFHSINYNLNVGEVFTNDYATIREVSSYVKKNTEATDKLLVFETQQAKIGPLIYFESAKNLIWLKRGFNCLDVTYDERDEVIESLKNEEHVRILFIGGRPPRHYQNGNYVYDFILRNYVIEKEFGPYTPYPGRIENLTITLLRDLRSVIYSSTLKLNLSDFKGASFRIEYSILTLSGKFGSRPTLYYPFDAPVDLSSAVLKMQIVGGNENNILYVDLVDEKGNYIRHNITYSSDWREIMVPINRLTFPSGKTSMDIQRIKQINLIPSVTEDTINLSIKEMSLLKILELGATKNGK